MFDYFIQWTPQRLEQWETTQSKGKPRFILMHIFRLAIFFFATSSVIFLVSSAIPNVFNVFPLVILVLISGFTKGLLEWSVTQFSYQQYKQQQDNIYDNMHELLWGEVILSWKKRFVAGIILVGALLLLFVVILELRPYIYESRINDFGVTGVLPNFLIVLGTSFCALLVKHTSPKEYGQTSLSILGGIIVYEVIQLGNPARTFDLWDIVVSIVGATVAFGIARRYFFLPRSTFDHQLTAVSDTLMNAPITPHDSKLALQTASLTDSLDSPTGNLAYIMADVNVGNLSYKAAQTRINNNPALKSGLRKFVEVWVQTTPTSIPGNRRDIYSFLKDIRLFIIKLLLQGGITSNIICSLFQLIILSVLIIRFLGTILGILSTILLFVFLISYIFSPSKGTARDISFFATFAALYWMLLLIGRLGHLIGWKVGLHGVLDFYKARLQVDGNYIRYNVLDNTVDVLASIPEAGIDMSFRAYHNKHLLTPTNRANHERK